MGPAVIAVITGVSTNDLDWLLYSTGLIRIRVVTLSAATSSSSSGGGFRGAPKPTGRQHLQGVPGRIRNLVAVGYARNAREAPSKHPKQIPEPPRLDEEGGAASPED